MSDMLKIYEILDKPEQTNIVLELPFEERKKSRLRTVLNNGVEVGIMLPRGLLLRGGDCLKAEDESIVRIEAANEVVSTVRHKNPVMLMRASYHLGNRHVSLQVGDGWLRYQHDHVLDEMVRGLGLNVICESAPFEPEPGAYSGHVKAHDHSHAHEK